MEATFKHFVLIYILCQVVTDNCVLCRFNSLNSNRYVNNKGNEAQAGREQAANTLLHGSAALTSLAPARPTTTRKPFDTCRQLFELGN